ncbi:hypothetical protein BHM03_00059674 [Ensete ventricosum]|nr:hypothetical protein BHM03_00059674 [Ensete ventricosum]
MAWVLLGVFGFETEGENALVGEGWSNTPLAGLGRAVRDDSDTAAAPRKGRCSTRLISPTHQRYICQGGGFAPMIGGKAAPAGICHAQLSSVVVSRQVLEMISADRS